MCCVVSDLRRFALGLFLLLDNLILIMNDFSRNNSEGLIHLFEAINDCFRKSFENYVELINNQQSEQSNEQTEFYEECDEEFMFVHPTPGYVVESSINEEKTVFINICADDILTVPNLAFVDSNTKVHLWNISYCLTPPKVNYGEKYNRHVMYDAIFHSKTVHCALEFSEIKQIVNNIAFDIIEENFQVELDRNSIKYPTFKYVGTPKRILIQNCISGSVANPQGLSLENVSSLTDGSQKKLHCGQLLCCDNILGIKSKICIKQVSGIYLQELIQDTNSTILETVSWSYILKIHLPCINIENIVNLDVSEKTIGLLSEVPNNNQLNVVLSYPEKYINEKVIKNVLITIPTKVEDFQSLLNFELVAQEEGDIDNDNNVQAKPNKGASELKTFFDPTCTYIFPSFTIGLLQNFITFTLNIKNVQTESLSYVQVQNCLCLKCSSRGPGSMSSQFAFWLKMDSDISDIQTEIWDNNVIIQFKFEFDVPCHIQDQKPSNETLDVITRHTCNKTMSSPESVMSESSDSKSSVPHKVSETNKIRSTSESSEEISSSFLKRRGILKFGSISRSVSESSVDDHYSFGVSIEPDFTGSSVDMISRSLDVCKDQEGSCKKTVRFNEEVSKQVYRSNSSILGQKKKNQRKSKNKKRAYERKLSESETSEGEEKTTSKCLDEDLNSAMNEMTLNNEENSDKTDKTDLIFQLEM